MEKIIVYKDGKIYYIPASFVGYGNLVEINGELIAYDNRSNMITSDEVKTIRLCTRTEVPIEYIYGTHKISVEDYDKRIEYLKKNFKEKIDEIPDEDGENHRVCIWTDKNAEIEYYHLTSKYTVVKTPVFKYGKYLDFETVTLPKSSSKYIIPDWKTTDKFGLTCTFDRKKFLKDTVEEISKKYPTLKVQNYMDSNYDPYAYINGVCHRPVGTGTFARAPYKDCVAAEKVLKKDIEEMFKLEFGKTKENPLCNATTTLNEVTSILSTFQRVKTEVATRDDYTRCFNMIVTLKKKLETEVKS